MGNNPESSDKAISEQIFLKECKKLSKNPLLQDSQYSDPIRKGSRIYIFHLDKGQTQGILFIPNIMYYQGSFQKGQPEGKGHIRWFENGEQIPSWPSYQGQFKEGNADGEGFYTANDFKFDGKWEKGSPVSGTLTVVRPDNKQYTYKIDKLKLQSLSQGYAQIELPGKNKYMGEIKKVNNHYCFDGNGTMKFSNNDSYVGEWKNGRMEGQGEYRWKQGTIYNGCFKDGVKNGIGCLQDPFGKKEQGIWKDGRRVQLPTNFSNPN